MEKRKIKRALISLYNKEGIEQIARELEALGVEIISTGGTYNYLKERGVSLKSVEELTSYPSILGGRVKTLHPKLFGAILAREEQSEDRAEILEYGIETIDLVMVDLYPFREFVSNQATHQEIIEKIDIGGVSLIRAAAKNYERVLILSSKEQFSQLEELLKRGGESSLEERYQFALEAFKASSSYDLSIADYLSKGESKRELRYGENPHQKGTFYGSSDSLPKQIHGKELSYNNLLDIEAAIELIMEFESPTVAILKHNNACGCATKETILEGWRAALAADPLSAFGGVIVANREVEEEAAVEIDRLFFEVIIAPSYTPKALEILKGKKNRIILINEGDLRAKEKSRSLLGGLLVQERDSVTEGRGELKLVTKREPTEQEIDDLLFANKIVKHSKSNAIVLAKRGVMIGSGVGETSRVDAVKQAVAKAKEFNQEIEGAVMASDAFFPFSDSVEIAKSAGIKAVIQPGGSLRDGDSIEYCNNNELAMVLTGIRHFKH